MNDHLNDEKSCGPQLNDDAPQEEWGLYQLGEYARAQHDAIEQSEQSVTAIYWRLGHACRPLYVCLA